MPRSTPNSSEPSDPVSRRRADRLAFIIHVNDLWQALPKPLQTVGWTVTAATGRWIAVKAGLGTEVENVVVGLLRYR